MTVSLVGRIAIGSARSESPDFVTQATCREGAVILTADPNPQPERLDKHCIYRVSIRNQPTLATVTLAKIFNSCTYAYNHHGIYTDRSDSILLR